MKKAKDVKLQFPQLFSKIYLSRTLCRRSYHRSNATGIPRAACNHGYQKYIQVKWVP